MPLDLTSVYSKRDRARLTAATPAEVEASLLALCDQAETVDPDAPRPGEFDSEALYKLGSFLASCGQGSVDGTLLDWAAARRTVNAWAVACEVLRGLWGPRPDAKPLVATPVARLIEVANLVERATATTPNPQVKGALWYTLGAVLGAPSATIDAIELAAGAIRQLLSGGTGDPTLDKNLSIHAPRKIDAAMVRLGRDPVRWDEFRAYVQQESDRKSYVVEWRRGASEVARVTSLRIEERALRVSYEIADSVFTDFAVAGIVFEQVIVGLLDDRYRGACDRIEWLNDKSGHQMTSRQYAPPA
jgi:hypothetical protein